MIKYTLCKINPGKRKIWENWCRELMENHLEEGVESIIEEDLLRERCVIFGEGDESFVFYEHKSIPGKEKKPFNPNREINLKHDRIIKECLKKIESGVLGYDFEVK